MFSFFFSASDEPVPPRLQRRQSARFYRFDGQLLQFPAPVLRARPASRGIPLIIFSFLRNHDIAQIPKLIYSFLCFLCLFCFSFKSINQINQITRKYLFRRFFFLDFILMGKIFCLKFIYTYTDFQNYIKFIIWMMQRCKCKDNF